MKLVYIKRKTVYENRYSKEIGKLRARVTYIKKYFLGVPVNTIHAYRETYYGEVKDCNDCHLFI